MNPYPQVLQPVREELFFGRSQITSRLLGHLLKPGMYESVAIIGPRGIGKSSLLLHLREQVRLRGNPLVVTISGDEWTSAERTSDLFLSMVIDRLRTALRAAAPRVSRRLPDSVGELARIAHENNLRPFIFLDSFERLVRRWNLGLEMFGIMRGWLHGDYRVTIALASTEPFSSFPRSFDASGLSSTFGTAGTHLGPLTHDEVQKLIEEPAHRASLILPARTVDTLIGQCGGHPFFTNVAAGALADRVLSALPLDLQENDWQASVDAACRPHLDTVLGEALSVHDAGLRRLVEEDMFPSCGASHEAGQALVAAGLAQWEETHFRCLGAAYRRYLSTRFLDSAQPDGLASLAEREAFWGRLADVEPRMRAYVEHLFGGATALEAAMPTEMRTRANRTGRRGSVIDNVTFGDLFQLLQLRAPRSAKLGLSGIVDIAGTRTLRDVRNGVAHNAAIRRADLSRAIEEARAVQRFLEQFVA
jgi:hypothetical protein